MGSADIFLCQTGSPQRKRLENTGLEDLLSLGQVGSGWVRLDKLLESRFHEEQNMSTSCVPSWVSECTRLKFTGVEGQVRYL